MCRAIKLIFIKIFTTQIAEVFVGSSKISLSLKANPDLAVNSVVQSHSQFMVGFGIFKIQKEVKSRKK